MTIIDLAIHFVTNAMSGKTRKGNGAAAVFHSLEAGAIASSLTNDSEIIAAVLLHDVIEDAGITANDLREQFGERVTSLVLSETENKRVDIPPCLSWRLRKEEAIDTLKRTDDAGVKILFLSDKLSNLRSVAAGLDRVGTQYWQKFNQKDPEMHHWYYREIANALSVLEETPEWKEYDRLIKTVFNEGEKL